MDIQLHTIRSGYDRKTCWVGPSPALQSDGKCGIMGVSQLTLTGSDVFKGSNFMFTEDGGATWSDPILPEAFARKQHETAKDCTYCHGVSPFWHRAGNRYLGLTQKVNYTPDNVVSHDLPRTIGLSTLEPGRKDWTKPIDIDIPKEIDKDGKQFGMQGSELDNGEILMPISIRNQHEGLFSTYVVRLEIEGNAARILEYGNELKVQGLRGLYEPSLVQFGRRYYLSLRNDTTGYVAVSDDGLHFDGLQSWCFDDAELLGNYNTQQRWVKNGEDELYLVYNRRNADNDNVFRHRAPLFIARVDVDKMRVVRESEQVLVPNRGARLGNFGHCQLAGNKTWISVAEWMQNDDFGYDADGLDHCESFGSDNSIFIAEINF